MNDSDDGASRPGEAGDAAGSPGGAAQEPVGSVGVEAAKLLGAISDWAKEQGAEYSDTAVDGAASFSNAVRDVSEHLATGSQDCRYCPVCQVIHVVRQTSPEVRTHLTVAASSLMQAAAALLSTDMSGTNEPRSPVERIDLDSDADWDEDR